MGKMITEETRREGNGNEDSEKEEEKRRKL